MIRIALLLLTTLSLPAQHDTVAYLCWKHTPDSFFYYLEQIADQKKGNDGKDPFEDEGLGGGGLTAYKKYPDATASQFPSRFLKKEHQLYDLTEDLRRHGYLKSKTAWAILNTTTKRLVVHAPTDEHRLLREVTEANYPRMEVRQSMEFFVVPTLETRFTKWSDELIARQKGKSLGRIMSTGTPGAKSHYQQVGETLVNIDWESEILLNHPFSELLRPGEGRNHLQARLKIGDQILSLDWKINTLAIPKRPQFFELGSAGRPDRTIVLKYEFSHPFIDGTPFAQARLSEKPIIGHASDANPENPVGKKFPDGTTIQSTRVPITFIEGLYAPIDFKNPDPFSEDLPRVGELPLQILKTNQSYGLAGQHIYDVKQLLENRGVIFKKEGWAYYNEDRSVVWTRLDDKNFGLFTAIAQELGTNPKYIGLSATLMETDQKPTRDLLEKKITAAKNSPSNSQLRTSWLIKHAHSDPGKTKPPLRHEAGHR